MTEDGQTRAQEYKNTRAQVTCALVTFGLVLLCLAAFEGVRHNEFINYDDDVYVTATPQVQGGLNFKSAAWAFTTLRNGNWHPLTWISHIIDYSLFGNKPAGHHLVSVGIHIANVILFFLILKKMTGDFWPSAFVAAVFGLHPLAVESVAWAAERKNVLSTFFAFLTIAAYLRYVKKPAYWRYVLVMVLFAAGLLSKPMAVTLPFVLILLDYWPLNRLNSKFSILNSIFEKLPLIAMTAASCLVTYIAQAKEGAVADIAVFPVNLRIGNAIVSYVGYIGKIFYPGTLAVLYPREVRGFALWQVGACLLFLAMIAILAVILRRKYGWLFTGWFWYLGTLVPVIGIVQVGLQGMADRYMYLPVIGFYIIVAWLTAELVSKMRIPKAVTVSAGAAVLVVLLLMTRAQVRYWKDSSTLYERTLAVTKDNYVMHAKYGNLLRLAGRAEEAERHIKRAVEIRPGYFLSHGQLALLYRDKGMFAEAAEEFEISLKAKPNNPVMRNHYGVMLLRQGMYEKAMSEFREALTSEEYFTGILQNFCSAGLKAGKSDEVIAVLEEWQRKKPKEPQLYYRAGIIYGQKGDNARAIEQLEKGLTLARKQGDMEIISKIEEQLGNLRNGK